MEVRFIEKGTKLDIHILASISASSVEASFKGTFFDTDTYTSFFIICDELFKRFNEFDENFYLKFSFIEEHTGYSFYGKMKDILTKHRKNLIRIDIVSMIEKYSVRKSYRIDVSLPIKLYRIASETPKTLGNLLCDGLIQDLSNEGICFLTNNKIAEADGQYFFVEFSFNSMERFVLKVKLMRKGNSPNTVQYKYDYGFLFEFNEKLQEKDKLTISLFENRVKGLI